MAIIGSGSGIFTFSTSKQIPVNRKYKAVIFPIGRSIAFIIKNGFNMTVKPPINTLANKIRVPKRHRIVPAIMMLQLSSVHRNGESRIWSQDLFLQESIWFFAGTGDNGIFLPKTRFLFMIKIPSFVIDGNPLSSGGGRSLANLWLLPTTCRGGSYFCMVADDTFVNCPFLHTNISLFILLMFSAQCIASEQFLSFISG